jgi:hypothetical protein
VPETRLRWFEKFGNDCVAMIREEEKRLAGLQAPPPPQQTSGPPAPPALAA